MKDVLYFTAWSALKLLESPDRNRIIEMCGAKPRSIQDLARELGLNPGSVHNHVHKLHDAGMLEVVATRTVNGIEERKYQRTAKHFDFSRMDPADLPKRNDFIAKAFQRDVAAMLAEDERATARRLSAELSPEHAAKALELLRAFSKYLADHDGSGTIRYAALTAFGQRK